MLGLIKLPVEIGFRVAKGVLEIAWGLLHEDRQASAPGADGARARVIVTEAQPPRARKPAQPRQRRSEPPPPPPPEPIEAAEPVPAEPDHVDTGVELVASFSEPGAADGAGAEIDVAEPWEGYARMRAADVAKRLAGASREEAAAVELYEATHRKRSSVMSAAERRLKYA